MYLGCLVYVYSKGDWRRIGGGREDGREDLLGGLGFF